MPQDKPLDALREETIDRLIMNYGHGVLSLEAFQRRLDEAFDASDHQTLQNLTADLDLQVDSAYVQQKRESLELHPRQRLDPDTGDVDDVEHIVYIFGGGDRGGNWTVPGELRVITIFGGADIDLTEARFTSANTRIRLLCLFGGVDIYVPEGINTTVNAFCIFGAVDNKAPNSSNPWAPRLAVDGLVMFGGADVKLRKTVKERMQDFADGLRSMFGKAPPPRRD
ncbi:MAG: LiaF-related protein [Gammaproteobacteria bacterium]|nr:LiaF-related protein [Gammaproteobacteria bacterium]